MRTGRLSANVEAYGEAPRTLEHATDPQKRIVMYLKVFRNVYGLGQRGIRIDLPLCVVARIRRHFSGGVTELMDENEDQVLEGNEL